MALWKARSLTPEQKVQIIEEESEEAKSLQTEESGTFLGVEDATMSEVYSAVLPVPVISLCLSFSFAHAPFFCVLHTDLLGHMYLHPSMDIFIVFYGGFYAFILGICLYLTMETVLLIILD